MPTPVNDALRSKLVLLRDDFVANSRRQVVVLDQQLAERGMQNSGVRESQVWAIVVETGLEMAKRMLDVCFEVGKIRNAADAAAIVKDEYAGFVRSWRSTDHNHTQTLMESQAMSMVSKIELEAHSRLFDALAREPKEGRLARWVKQLDPMTKFIAAATTFGGAAVGAWHLVAKLLGK